MNNSAGRRIADENGTIYELDRRLGEGGQGTVFLVRNGRQAVKILQNTTQSRREDLRRQIRLVRQLDLAGINIARPIALLKEPKLGYVMEFLSGMESLNSLVEVPRQTDDIGEWYLQGGGLRRRLRLLAKCAELFAQLHAKGLAYGDPSPNNIFISSNNEADEVWLIDTDNLKYDDSASNRGFYTSSYGAPELELGKSGTNTLTDAHAFAVIAFKSLSLVHPLMGDLVDNGDPDLITQALQGKLPWIDDSNDDLNRSSQGLPREIILSPKLRKLCQRTFGEGLNNPLKRPAIKEWIETLHSAADYTLKCDHCSNTFYANNTHCSWCDVPRSQFIQVAISRWEPQHGIVSTPLQAIALELNVTTELTSRITTGITDHQRHQPSISLKASQESTGISITVQSLNGKSYWLTSNGRDNVEVEISDRPKRFPLDPQRFGTWVLHFAPLDQPQRVAKFTLVSGVAQ